MTLYRQGKVPGSFYDGFGQEAVSAGPAWAMHGHDRLCILHRDLAAHLIRGVTPARIFAQYMGRAGGITGGRDGNVHFGDRTRRLRRHGLDAARHDARRHRPGDGLQAARRAARGADLVRRRLDLARRLPRGDELGRRAAAAGDLRPGEQPVRVLDAARPQFAVDPVERAAAYGFPGVSVDGNDVEAMFEATRQARERALAGEGPTLIEAVTMRMHGHAAHDDMKYVPAEQIEEWRRKDPIDRQVTRLEALGVDVAALREEVKAEIEAGVEEALAMPMPDGETATDRVFADEPALLEDGALAAGAGSRRRADADDDLPAGDLRRACARRCAPTSACS